MEKSMNKLLLIPITFLLLISVGHSNFISANELEKAVADYQEALAQAIIKHRFAYRAVENCYERRKGYLAVYINDDQWRKAKEDYDRNFKNIDVLHSPARTFE